MRASFALLTAFALVCLMGCRTDDPPPDQHDASVSVDAAVDAGPDGGGPDAGGSDAGPDCNALAQPCVSEFGSLFNRSNGRADGTLIALVRPQDTGCLLYNDDHAVLQLSIQGHNQRLVVSVDDVAVHQIDAPLIGPPFAAGWHTGMTLDYVAHLGVSASEFTSVSMAEAVAFLCAELELGAPVSVYAYSDGDYPSSAHQIHRNDNYPDGAIVVRPDTPTPTWLLFRYNNQTF